MSIALKRKKTAEFKYVIRYQFNSFYKSSVYQYNFILQYSSKRIIYQKQTCNKNLSLYFSVSLKWNGSKVTSISMFEDGGISPLWGLTTYRWGKVDFI